MVARACGHSSEELIAIGFTKREVAKWQRIASRYRRRQKPEPDPGPWLKRYRKKLKEGWTCKTKKPEGVDGKLWVRFLNCASYHRVHKNAVPDFQTYLREHFGRIGG